MEHDGGEPAEAGERGSEIVIPQAGPDLLLGPTGDPERREVAGPGGVVEVGSDRKLEDALLERRRVALAETALPKAPALFLKPGARLRWLKRRSNLVPGCAPGRRGRDQRQPLDPLGDVEGVEQREEPAPGVAGEGEPLEPPALAQRLEVGHLLGPADRASRGTGDRPPPRWS